MASAPADSDRPATYTVAFFEYKILAHSNPIPPAPLVIKYTYNMFIWVESGGKGMILCRGDREDLPQ